MKTIIKVFSYIVITIFVLITNIAFAFEDTCPNETQPLVSSGTYYICSFTAPGEMDTYRISVSKGDRISVAVAVLQAIDKTGSTPTPKIRIINPDGSRASSRYDTNGVFDDATMNSDGLATIIVTDDYRQNTLQYSVQVNCTGFCGTEDLFGGNAYVEGLQLENSNHANKDSEGQGACDRVGNYYICSFTAPGEMDAYRILVSKGDRISVAVAVLQALDVTGSTPTPRIRIINPDGSRASSRYDTNGVFDDAVMNSTGLATIIVTDDYRQNTLKYSLQVNCTGFCGSDNLFGGNSYEEGYKDGLNTSASSISAVSGELDTCPFAQPIVSSGAYFICSFRAVGEMDAYRIKVSKGDRISVAVAVLQAIDKTGSTPTPRIRIINPNGSRASSRYDTNGVFDDATMNSDGLATIIVTDDYRQNTLQYSVQINCVGTCSDSSDGDLYLSGYQEGLKGEAIIISPNPIIKANGSEKSITITPDDNLKIEIGLDTGSGIGTNSDWWLAANTPFGWFSYDLRTGSWIPGINVTYQDALFSFDLFDFMNISGLPSGTFTLYFGVDTLMNGKLDMDQLQYDSVEVNVNPVSSPVDSKTLRVNEHQLSKTEELWVRYVASDVLPRLLGNRNDQIHTASIVSWWGLKEGLFSLNNPHSFSNCSPGEKKLDPLITCGENQAWQVGLAGIQVPWNNPMEVIDEVFTNKADDRVILEKVARLLGYQEQEERFDAVINSDGYLKKSLLLRHPFIAFELQERVVQDECIDNEESWCYGTGWDQTAWYAATKDATLQSIKDLSEIYLKLYSE